MALGGAELNEAKKMLATEVTAIVHGRDAAEQAANTARATFEAGAIDLSLPTVDVPPEPSSRPASACWRRWCRAGLAASNGEARRAIQGGAIRLNDSR